MHYVYILELSNGDYYKGCTNNIEERLKRHQNGQVDSTKNYLPLKLVTYTVFWNQQKAYAYEKYLKSGSGRAFMNRHLI
ncbi:MAG: GIY-YIG nuclease family protein [Ferruginibacter sp.]|jgi:putative endonuclease|nr:GIY-YIG nuclease family protein [Ferruginibacter sp.]